MQNVRQDSAFIARIRAGIEKLAAGLGDVKLMHVCGTHEMTITAHGLRDVLPDNVAMLAGPGCPVCVTPTAEIDAAIELANRGAIVTSFGDMMRVPGSTSSLFAAKAAGADVRIVQGATKAVEIARNNPERDVVFMAVGFETTTPPTAAVLLDTPPENFSVIVCHRTIPAAAVHLLKTGEIHIDGLLDPGHVSAIIGANPYKPVSEHFSLPQVIAGFEPEDVLMGILMLLKQIADGTATVENEYFRVVTDEGNTVAQSMIADVFTPCDSVWRGLSLLPGTGLALRSEFAAYDALACFDVVMDTTETMPPGCSCGSVLRGEIGPEDCPLFGTACTPKDPVGPCMVSHEGTCAIVYKYKSRGRPGR